GVRLRGAELDRGAEIDRARDVRAGLAAHEVGKAARKLALVRRRKGAKQHVGDDEAEHMVAEELEALVAAGAALAGERRNMRQRAVEQRRWGEAVPDALLQLLASLRLAAHRTIVNSRPQRTVQGQSHTYQAGSRPRTEKKTSRARPIRFSAGTKPTPC